MSDTGVSPGVYVQMELRLYLPEGVMPVDVDQAVVRWARGLAFGVEFLAMQLGEQERLHRFVSTLRQEPSVTDRIIQTVAENPECQLDDVLLACPDLTWNQIFSEVDHLSRSGQVRLRQKSAGVYTLSLPGTDVGLAEYLSPLADKPIDKGQRVASLCESFQDETPELAGGTDGSNKEQCDPNGLPGEAGSINSQRDGEAADGQIEQKTTMTKEEFERAVTEFRPRLVGYIESLGRDPADAEDIVQDALRDLTLKYEGFVGNNEWAIRAWFREAVKITNKRFGRKAGRDQKHVLHGQDIQRSRRREDENPHELWDPKDPNCSNDPAESSDITKAVQKAIEEIPHSDIRDAIWRHHVDKVPIPEIAVEMGVKAKTLTSMLRPWETKLRERLKDFSPPAWKKGPDSIAS